MSPLPRAWTTAAVPTRKKNNGAKKAAAPAKKMPVAIRRANPVSAPRRATAAATKKAKPAIKHLIHRSRTASRHRILATRADVTSTQLSQANDSIFGKGPVLILVYNDGCMYCNRLKPDWDKAAANVVPSLNVDVMEIDSTAVSMLPPGSNQMVDAIRSKYSGSVPYIGMLRADRSVETYNGDRSPADIVKFVRNNSSS